MHDDPPLHGPPRHATSPRPDRPTVFGLPPSPRDRPPLALRVLVGLLGVMAALGAVLVMLSDRAPGVLRTVFGPRARELWERIDASERVDLPPGSELPPADFVVHVAIWATVAVLAGLALWSWRSLVVVAVGLAVASGLVELAQGRYATARTVESDDVVANLVGVAIGTAVAATCYLVWSVLAAALRRMRSSPTSA